MTQPQGITIEYKNNFMGTFISTLVAVLVAVPVAMFVSYTLIQANNASASTNQQTATASPVNTVGYPVAAVSGGSVSCTSPTSSEGEAGAWSGTADMSYLPGGGMPQYVVNNTSTITQNQSETNNTTTITDSYNDNSTNDSFNTDIEVDVEIEDSFQDNDVTIRDSFQDNDVTVNEDNDVTVNDNDVTVNEDNDVTITDSFQDNSVDQTAIGLFAANVNL